MKKKNLEIDLEILSTGEVRFRREKRREYREFLLGILSHLVDDEEKIIKIKNFLDGAEDIDLILGDEILCG